MGNIQFCNYNLLLYAKAWRRVFQATKTTYKPAGNKGADFQVWEVANHSNATTKRFMKKLGSLPSRTDEISALQVSPKSNCLTKIWHKIPVFGANTSFELKHFRGFFVAQKFNTTLPHRPASMSKMTEILWLGEDDELGNAPWLENKKHYLGSLQKPTISKTSKVLRFSSLAIFPADCIPMSFNTSYLVENIQTSWTIHCGLRLEGGSEVPTKFASFENTNFTATDL